VRPEKYIGGWEDAVPQTVSVTCGWCATAVEVKRVSQGVESWRDMVGFHQNVLVSAAFVCPREQCRRMSILRFLLVENVGDV
jgi:hypothetical protein